MVEARGRILKAMILGEGGEAWGRGKDARVYGRVYKSARRVPGGSVEKLARRNRRRREPVFLTADLYTIPLDYLLRIHMNEALKATHQASQTPTFFRQRVPRCSCDGLRMARQHGHFDKAVMLGKRNRRCRG